MALIVGLLISACAGPKEKTAGDVVDDTWIHTKVKSVLSTNRGASINIEVYKGEVQLAGFTTDPGLRKSLPDHASRVSGVKKVYNQIIVVDSGRSTGEALDDGLVVTRVNGALADTSLDEAIKIMSNPTAERYCSVALSIPRSSDAKPSRPPKACLESKMSSTA
jgi:osmotically-inducible protein OsmY